MLYINLLLHLGGLMISDRMQEDLPPPKMELGTVATLAQAAYEYFLQLFYF